MKPFSEKTEEILFSRYLLQSCGLGKISLVAPTSVQEYKEGYDARIFGAKSFRELYLQFKSPSLSKNGLFRITTTEHQHVLLRKYPPRSAYYVTHTFHSLEEMQTHERNLNQSIEFLRHFIAIEISELPEDTKFFTYTKPESTRASVNLDLGTSADKGKRKAPNQIKRGGWIRCSQLLKGFQESEIGAQIQLIDDEAGARNGEELLNESDLVTRAINEDFWRLSPARAEEMANGYGDKRDFGIIMYRGSL